MANQKKLIDISDQEIEAIYDSGKEATVSFIRTLIDKVNDLAIIVEKQQQEIDHLKSIINKDSHNSSKPPSSDSPFKKKKKTNSLRKKGGKVGGQPGRKGSNLEQTKNPDIIKQLKPSGRCSCGKNKSQGKIIGTEKRQVFDLPEIKIQVTEYQAQIRKCDCGKIHPADFPEGLNIHAQYGENIKSLVVYLKHYGFMSYERLQDFIKDVLNQKISQGTLVNMVNECAKKMEPFTQQIKASLIKSDLIHFDETGFRIEGERHWLHSAGNNNLTFYYPHKFRGKKAMDDIGILPFFKGIAVHDHYLSYFKYMLCMHALCNAHHLRELIFFAEQEEEWAGKIINCLLDAKEEKDQGLDFSYKRINYYRNRLNRLLNEGLKMHPVHEKIHKARGRTKQSKQHNLLRRMKARIDEVFRFILEKIVPFDNNLAERDVRMAKVQQKISGTFRSFTGAINFCTIRSYISTVRKQNISVFQAIAFSFKNQMIISVNCGE